jgi:hypothetical protein
MRTHEQAFDLPRSLALHENLQKVVAAAHGVHSRTPWTHPHLRAELPTCAVYLHSLLMQLPAPLRLLWNGWMTFSHILGNVMSKVILTMLWIVGFGTYAVILRIVAIRKLFAKEPESYWIDVHPDPVEHMKYPF